MKKALVGLLAVGALSACAPTTKWATVDSGMVAAEREKQMDLAAEALMNDHIRLSNVADPILAGAVDLCGEKVTPWIGAAWIGKNDMAGALGPAFVRRYRLTDIPVVVIVVKGGGAEKAGLRVGDEVLAINGTGTMGKKSRVVLNEALNDKTRWPIKITARRNGKELLFAMNPQRACDYPVALNEEDMINAFADGKQIYVTRGMMRFINSDQELALVISHELAHNTMGHIDKKMGNTLLGTVVDVVAAAYGVNTQGLFGKMAGNAYSQDFEMEADYVGLYAMALSGQEVEGAANFWRRMAAANPGGIGQRGYFASHPSSPERYLAIEKAAGEIGAKRLAGSPLRPEQKEGQQTDQKEGQFSKAE